MNNYFFVKENTQTPFYDFPNEFCESVPCSIFTFPKQPIPLVIKCLPVTKYNIQDVITFPSFALKHELFITLNLTRLFGVNWVDIILFDNGKHEFNMLQLCNEIKIIDRTGSNLDLYENDGNDELIVGINELVINEQSFQNIPLNKRLIFRDPAWTNEVFFHESIVEEIMNKNPLGIEFINASGYSEFV